MNRVCFKNSSLKGHGFSHAVQSQDKSGALAPEGSEVPSKDGFLKHALLNGILFI
jgi:hypothetical protein